MKTKINNLKENILAYKDEFHGWLLVLRYLPGESIRLASDYVEEYLFA